MANTSDVLKLVTYYLDSQEQKKQRKFDNALRLRDVAQRMQDRDLRYNASLYSIANDTVKHVDSALEDLQMTREQLYAGTNLNSNGIKEIIDNTEYGVVDKVEKAMKYQTEIYDIVKNKREKQRKFVQTLFDFSISDDDPFFSEEEIANFKADRKNLSDVEEAWLQNYVNTNLQQSATRENYNRQVAMPINVQNEVGATLQKLYDSGDVSKDSANKGLDKLINKFPKYENAIRSALSPLYEKIDTLTNSSNAETTIEDVNQQKGILKEERLAIKAEADNIMKFYNKNIPSGVPTVDRIDMSPKSIDGDIRGIVSSIYMNLRDAKDATGIPRGIKGLMKNIDNESNSDERYQLQLDLIHLLQGKGNEMKVQDGKKVVTLARKHGVGAADANYPLDVLKGFDFSNSPLTKGGIQKGRGYAVREMIDLVRRMEDYQKKYEEMYLTDQVNEKIDDDGRVKKLREDIFSGQ